jgi:hypothetical protein
MKTLLVPLLSIALAFPAALAAAPVSVAGGDWSNIPLVHQTQKLRISADTIDRIEQAAFGECAKPGQSKRRADVTVPFLIRFTPTGEVEQVVVHRVDCPAIEQVAGGAVYQLAADGEYKPTGENAERWYRGVLSISLR